MNKQILELVEQNDLIHEWMTPGEQNDLLRRYEKFAELIVKECQQICNSFSEECSPESHAEVIGEHFGVK